MRIVWDKYMLAARYLSEHPEDIEDAWYGNDGSYRLHCLFATLGIHCGCLTQIRSDPQWYSGPTPELTAAIRADERIPLGPRSIRVADLPVFVEWQRRIDEEVER
jgi:hypothetical protein